MKHELTDNSVQLVVTSPPYNLNKEYEKRVGVVVGLQVYINALAPILFEIVRVLKPGGSLCWQVGNFVHDGGVFPLDIAFDEVWRNRGLKLRNRIIWRFEHGLHAQHRFSGRYETIMWYTKDAERGNYVFNLDAVRVPQKYPGKKHYKGPKRGQLSGNPLGNNPGDVWDIPNVVTCQAAHPSA